MPHSYAADSYRLEAVKICGTTGIEDRDLAADAGADYFGVLVDVGYSTRSVTLEQATPMFESPPVPGVALLFNPSASRVWTVVQQLKPFAIQLLGHEMPDFIASLKSELDCQIWKSLHIPASSRGWIDVESMKTLAEEYEDSGTDVICFTTVDSTSGMAKFGTGMVGDWGLIRGLANGRAVPCYLGGGIDPSNVVAAIQSVRPNGIDVCSGVEASRGKKDPEKLKALFQALAPFRA